MLPTDVHLALTRAAPTLAQAVRRAQPDLPITDAATAALLTALALRMYALLTQHAPEGAQVRFRTDQQQAEVALLLGRAGRGVWVVDLARAVMFTPDGVTLTPVFTEHGLNGDDVPTFIVFLAQHDPAERLLQRTARQVIRAAQLMQGGLSELEADHVAVQEHFEGEPDVTLRHVTPDGRPRTVARGRTHDA